MGEVDPINIANSIFEHLSASTIEELNNKAECAVLNGDHLLGKAWYYIIDMIEEMLAGR